MVAAQEDERCHQFLKTLFLLASYLKDRKSKKFYMFKEMKNALKVICTWKYDLMN